ncbi:hypothetical protein CALCODRAFT_443983, partial [Calocera cornea HHB12733]
DVHVALDAQFGHRQSARVLLDPLIAPHQFFLSTCELDDARSHVNACRSRRSEQAAVAPQLEDDVLDRCEQSFKAADQDRQRARAKAYTVHGIMAIVCRHNVPLFIANLVDPGERHYYAVALIRKVSQHLPGMATLGILYDIACQLDRAMRQVRLMGLSRGHAADTLLQHGYMPELRHRVTWGTSVLHAYGHQWACQLVYHPRKCPGFGFSDGENCERLWSETSDLIPSERLMGPHRREYAIEARLTHLALQHRLGLGTWLTRQLRKVQQRRAVAITNLAQQDVSHDTLRTWWKDQQESQCSLRSCTPLPQCPRCRISSCSKQGLTGSLTMQHSDSRTWSRNMHAWCSSWKPLQLI